MYNANHEQFYRGISQASVSAFCGKSDPERKEKRDDIVSEVYVCLVGIAKNLLQRNPLCWP